MYIPEDEARIESPGTGHELLEELLTYDDLFLESFNAFLALPAFPLRLHYDRLTGRLQELDGFFSETLNQMDVEPSSPCYGVTDAERERALAWLAQERLLPFQRTVFYLEYKLAKLLICPLDESYPVNRYAIRGYSRQSDSTAVSSIPSHSSTWVQSTGIPSHMLLRFPSQTRSTPAYLDRFASLPGRITVGLSLESSSVLGLGQSPAAECLSSLQLQSLLSESSIESASGRLRSGGASAGEPRVSLIPNSRAALPVSSLKQDFTELHMDGYGKTISEPRKILQFDLDETPNSKEEQLDLCYSHGFGTAALQPLKEDVLGTRAGMDSFRQFLHGTLGIHLLDFWIECEDLMEHTRCLEATASPKETQLFFSSGFRDIQAKYKLTVLPAFQKALGETVGPEETAFAALSRKQYDALRRLRSYWVPRFLIHYQRTAQIRLEPSSRPQMEEELFLSTDLLSSLNTAALLPGLGDQREMLSSLKRKKDKKMQLRKKGKHGIAPAEQLHFPEDPFERPTTTRFLQALMFDLGDGDGFLHYLARFENPEKIHNFLLWRRLKLYKSAWEQQATLSEVHQIALHIFDTFLASSPGCSLGLSSSMLEYVKHLERTLSTQSGDLKPSTFEPVIRYVLAVLGSAWLDYLHYEVTTFLDYCVPTSHLKAQSTGSIKQEGDKRLREQSQNFWVNDPKGKELYRKRHRKKALPKSHFTKQGGRERSPSPRDSPTPPNPPDVLGNTVVLNVFSKAARKMQAVELEGILGLLQEVEACQDEKKRLDCAMKFLDMFVKPGALGSSPCLPKELKMMLKKELVQNKISDVSWNEIQLALCSFVAPAFKEFWDEISEQLKKYRIEPSQITEERWKKLERFLESIAAKVVLKHLTSQKVQTGSAAATVQPSREDKACFWQSLRKAAEGSPTIEMLHFLKHLQVHGLPVLESGLHFLLEVQKFKNAHHAWPDMALLKKKVCVIRDCFLTSQIEPRLQVTMDTQRLSRAIRAAELVLQEEIPLPPPSLFDELKNSVFSLLLPYWAAFWKNWIKRSTTSAQKVPVLRNQLLLLKRRAMLDEEQPPQPLHLPLLRQARGCQGSRSQGGFTYTFSISEGLTLQDMAQEGTSYSETNSSVFKIRKKATRFSLPSIPKVPVLIQGHSPDPKTGN
ncbi:uncharacterized protein LOC110074672 isoform X1 [Pogona vitticeps]